MSSSIQTTRPIDVAASDLDPVSPGTRKPLNNVAKPETAEHNEKITIERSTKFLVVVGPGHYSAGAGPPIRAVLGLQRMYKHPIHRV
jgi:hypothetical protein